MRREFTALPGAFDSFLFAYVEEAEPQHGMSHSLECVPPFTHGVLWGYAVHYTGRDSCTLRCRVHPAC